MSVDYLEKAKVAGRNPTATSRAIPSINQKMAGSKWGYSSQSHRYFEGNSETKKFIEQKN